MNRMLSSKRTIGIIWANPFSPNMGVAALSYSALILFNHIAKIQNRRFNIYIVGSSFSGEKKIRVLNERIRFFGIKRKDFFSIKSLILFCLFPQKSELYHSFKFESVFDVGEGDSYTDLYGKKRFRLLNNSKIFYRLIGKRQFLLPQTVGPFADNKIQMTAFKTLKKVNTICLRDRLSYEFVQKRLHGPHIEESIDMAFMLPIDPAIDAPHRGTVTRIGINISALLWGGGYTHNNQFSLGVDYRELIESIIRYFERIPHSSVTLVGHVFDRGRGIENDQSVNESLKQRFPFLRLAPEFRDPIEAKSNIRHYDFFVGARMHACIAAFSTNVPVFPIAYSRKFNGLFMDTLKYNHVGDCVNQSIETIMASLKFAYLKRKKLSKEIELINSNIVLPRIQELQNLLVRFMENG